jgi:hypothetical protein
MHGRTRTELMPICDSAAIREPLQNARTDCADSTSARAPEGTSACHSSRRLRASLSVSIGTREAVATVLPSEAVCI